MGVSVAGGREEKVGGMDGRGVALLRLGGGGGAGGG